MGGITDTFLFKIFAMIYIYAYVSILYCSILMPLDALFTNPAVFLLSFFPPGQISNSLMKSYLHKWVTFMSKTSKFIGLWYVYSSIYIVFFGSLFSTYSLDEIYIQAMNALLGRTLTLYVTLMWPATGL